MSKSEPDVGAAAGDGAEQTEERTHQTRREALGRFALYTAPVMLAMLASNGAMATVSAV
jgi:hypothetical protein